MHSRLYTGKLTHRRRGPARNAFTYSLYMMYLDLDELDSVFDRYWFWSAARPAPARFRREDHHGDPALPLAESIRQLVASETGTRPEGPVRLLTHLRYFGYCFNPISVYYCFDDQEALTDVVLEVSNTPWKDMHCYVLSTHNRIDDTGHRYAFSKAMHVSPFMPMDMEYRCTLRPPGEHLNFSLENWRDGERVFDAHLDLRERELSSAALARALIMDPLMTHRVSALIHWQAVKLWFKRVPVVAYERPGHTSGTASTLRNE